MPEPSKAQLLKLWSVCQGFVAEQKISAPETIYQTDSVIEGAYGFIEAICVVVGYDTSQDN